ncbi:unnamed protein product [Candidula unifasciata]|uniref:Riboflavin transporter n=1 Tax=Candidula unifasciata TaxID=100452 RepID=A0A8S3ZLX2_9EUPU|nr:unnamed protein product [Candidula unifasciata]
MTALIEEINICWVIISRLFGNIGPIFFTLIAFCKPNLKLETPASLMVVLALTLSALLYAFFWAETAIVAGDEHSGLIPAFAALGQGQGKVSCSNRRSWKVKISGILNTEPNNLSCTNHTDIMTAVNEEPPFSVQGFFLLLFGIGLVSVASFLLLVFHPYCRSEHVDTDKEENCQLMQPGGSNDLSLAVYSEDGNKTDTLISSNTPTVLQSTDPIPRDETANPPLAFHQTPQETGNLRPYATQDDTTSFYTVKNGASHGEGDTAVIQKPASKYDVEEYKSELEMTNKGKQITKLESWYLLGLLVWINALQTSFILAIQVYSSLPYGLQFYHGATKAENIVDPIASFLTFWVTARTTRAISGLTLLGTLFTAYIIVVASMSPNPFLVDHLAGGPLLVTAWVLCTMLMVFSKVSIAGVMRSQGRLSLMWTGASTQLGSVLGATVAYLTINAFHLFKDEPWCR